MLEHREGERDINTHTHTHVRKCTHANTLDTHAHIRAHT